MKLRNIRSLNFRQQIIGMFVCIICVMAPISAYFTSTISNELLKDQLYAQGEQLARLLAKQSKLALLYESNYSAQEAASLIAGHPDVAVREIRLLNGNTLYQSSSWRGLGADGKHIETPTLDSYEFEDEWIFVVKVLTEIDSDEAFQIIESTAPEAQQTILGFVSVSLSKNSLDLVQRRTFVTNVSLALAMGGAICIILLFSARRITKPVEQLSVTMERAEQGDTSVRAELKGQPEIAVMQHAFNTMMDVLEQRERQLEVARDKAVENARVKSEFAANVTHELRTPMNAVLGMLDLLDSSELNSRQYEYVGIAKHSAESLLTLIDDILDFSRAEANKTSLKVSDIDLRELLEDVTKLLASQALGKGLNIGYTIDPRITGKASLDRSRLQQTLINLLGNAIKFTDHGEVSIALGFSPSEHDQTTTNLLFEVSDTGIGIDQSDQETIFEAFRQADATSTREYTGTGLGLTISKQAIQMMNGEIGVISEKDHGSTFWFSIPVSSDVISSSNRADGTSSQAVGTSVRARQRALFFTPGNIIWQFANQSLKALNVNCDIARSYTQMTDQLSELRDKGYFYDFIVVDSDSYHDHQLQIDTLIGRYGSLYNATVVALTNPYHKTSLSSIFTHTIEKPLTRRDLLNLLEWRATPASEDYSRPSAPKPGAQPSRTLATTARILVVDDNRVNQQVAEEMLKKFGIAVHLASDGKAALGHVINNKYDLILMDCNMPAMDGYQCTREIRKLEQGRGTPIIAMTANNSSEERERCIDAGMDDFLSKPLRISVLENLIHDWLHIDISRQPSSRTADVLGSNKPSANTSKHVVYDEAMVSHLFETLGDTVYSVIEAFIEDTPIYIDSLKSALSKNNAMQARELAHTVKGSAATFGSHHLIESAKAIEDLAAQNCLSDCDPYIDSLSRHFEALKSALTEQVLNNEESRQEKASNDHTILVVDDDRTLRLALTSVFRKEGFQIIEATSGSQAIELCKRHIPDIILMDALMSDLDGFQACNSIRELPNCLNIPILMITSLDDEEAISKAFSSGATDFVTKPLHFTVLKERVSRLVKASKAGQKIRQMAYIDSLTNLPNRAKLMQELRVILDRANLHNRSAALLFLDLDNFKNINDSLGHNVGDLLLKVVADRLRGCVRETDFIARLGGDEFTIVLENINDNEDIARIARNICKSLSEPFVFLDKKMHTSSSIGIAMYPRDARDVNSLLKHADLAMFKAKKNKNQFVFYQAGMADEINKRIELEQDLRYAIDHDQLVLFFQPQVDVVTGEVTAAEVLVRWQHPEKGLLGPGEFIAIAEESDLITELTRWVVKGAVAQIDIWSKRGTPLKLSVNLSGKDISGNWQLINYLRNQAEAKHIDPALLELEITESILMRDPQKSRAEIMQLKNLGFTIAIDDFGTGYSSLNYLKNLPVDSLKIDRSFIHELEQNREDQAIVKGIIALAKSMNLKTIAEGVETEAQRSLISEFGCDVAQGFLFSRPLPIEEFDRSYLAKEAGGAPPRLKLV